MRSSQLRGLLCLDASAPVKLYFPAAESDGLNFMLRGLALAKSSGARTMVCFDHRLRTAAAAIGLLLFPTP